jgi:hypothetical protein
MSLFPLAWHRRPAPSPLEPALSRERADTDALSAFAAAVLFDPRPGGFTDRAMAGWYLGDKTLGGLEKELRLWAAQAGGAA